MLASTARPPPKPMTCCSFWVSVHGFRFCGLLVASFQNRYGQLGLPKLRWHSSTATILLPKLIPITDFSGLFHAVLLYTASSQTRSVSSFIFKVGDCGRALKLFLIVCVNSGPRYNLGGLLNTHKRWARRSFEEGFRSGGIRY